MNYRISLIIFQTYNIRCRAPGLGSDTDDKSSTGGLNRVEPAIRTVDRHFAYHMEENPSILWPVTESVNLR